MLAFQRANYGENFACGRQRCSLPSWQGETRIKAKTSLARKPRNRHKEARKSEQRWYRERVVRPLIRANCAFLFCTAANLPQNSTLKTIGAIVIDNFSQNCSLTLYDFDCRLSINTVRVRICRNCFGTFVRKPFDRQLCNTLGNVQNNLQAVLCSLLLLKFWQCLKSTCLYQAVAYIYNVENQNNQS